MGGRFDFTRLSAAGLLFLLTLWGAETVTQAQAPAAAPSGRPRIGVALGGGSARGLAHVGLLRWLEEHRIPVDVIAGTSMGGLIGGSYATGLSPDEIDAMLAEINWDDMFGRSGFEASGVRRKRDLRAYPSHLEFGLKGGIVPPTALNNGQQVDLLLARIAGPYYAINSFDELPTPFRAVAVDLKTARFVVLSGGSLSRAMRATMSLPLAFPPVVIGDQVLVDGGAMNNIPADVVRDLGADRVIAVNVGDLTDKAAIDTSMFGLMGSTLDAMMRASTKRALERADVVVDVPLAEYGSLDWRRSQDLIKEGYAAAEAMSARLLPFAVSDAEFQAWRAKRAAARRTGLPVPTFVRVEGTGRVDTSQVHRAFDPHIGKPLDAAGIEATLNDLGGMDRYESLLWEVVNENGADGLRITAQPKAYGPPFVFLGVSLENTTSDDFRFGFSGRYLAYDVLGSASELRIDAAIGSDPSAAIALFRPIWETPFFVEPFAAIGARSFNVIGDDVVVASYRQTRSVVGADLGVTIGRIDEVRAGVRYGRQDASVQIGDPGLPELGGPESSFRMRWTHDDGDSPIVPSRGLVVNAELTYYMTAPDAPPDFESTRDTEDVTQAETTVTWFHSLNRERSRRFFLAGSFGTSFNGEPLPTEQFALGGPLRLSAFNVGTQRGDHYVLGNAGYLHQIMRLPDFLGGPVFLSGWTDIGSAFNHADEADFDTQIGLGVIADTLIGPVFLGTGIGFDGSNRFYIGIGRIFR